MATYEGKPYRNTPLPLGAPKIITNPLSILKVEHNIPPPPPIGQTPLHRAPRRPDLSTFFSTLELVDTTNTTNTHAVPTPGDLSAAFRSLADAYGVMRQDGGSDLLEDLMGILGMEAERPPREVKGVSDDFLAGKT